MQQTVSSISDLESQLTEKYAQLRKWKASVTPEESKDKEMAFLLKRAERLLANAKDGEPL